MCLSRHLLPGCGASAISALSGKQSAGRDNVDTNRPHAFSLAATDDLTEAPFYDCPGQDETAEGSGYH